MLKNIMAYIEDDTPQHKTGAKYEDFIFLKYQEQGLDVYRQDVDGKLPQKMRDFINSEKIIRLLELTRYDFFWIINDQINVVEVKSKRVPQNSRKDERKFDTSQIQVTCFDLCEREGIKVKIHIVWWTSEDKYYDRCFDYKDSDITLIGGKKVKFKLPAIIDYSPERVEYKDFKK